MGSKSEFEQLKFSEEFFIMNFTAWWIDVIS